MIFGTKINSVGGKGIMATQKKDQLAVITAKIERRINLSEAMLKAMGVEPELFLRVALNAL